MKLIGLPWVEADIPNGKSKQSRRTRLLADIVTTNRYNCKMSNLQREGLLLF